MSKAEDKVFIEEIKEGRDVASAFLIDELRLGQTRGGKPFVGLKIKDRTGQMEARVWNRAEEFYRAVKNGDVAWIKGAAESFQGQVQLKVTSFQVLDPEGIDPSSFRPVSPYDLEEMFAELSAVAASLNDPHLSGLLEDVLSDPDLASGFKQAPAAKRFHHAYVGGLLEHTLSLTRAAEAVCRVYPELNRDLLLAGAIVHDLGKIREFDLGLSGDYTDQGRLMGHIVLGVEMIEKKLAGRPDFPPELALLLKHLILSHHGEYEMGSPKKPKVLEALALHHLDDLDAKMNGIGGFIQRHADEESGWTDYNRLMERFFFRPDFSEYEGPEKKAPAGQPEPEEDSGAVQAETDTSQLSFLED